MALLVENRELKCLQNSTDHASALDFKIRVGRLTRNRRTTERSREITGCKKKQTDCMQYKKRNLKSECQHATCETQSVSVKSNSFIRIHKYVWKTSRSMMHGDSFRRTIVHSR